jgi:hypothetical protein
MLPAWRGEENFTVSLLPLRSRTTQNKYIFARKSSWTSWKFKYNVRSYCVDQHVAIIAQEYSDYFKTCCNSLLQQKREGFCCGFMWLKKKFVLFCKGVRPGRVVTYILKHSLSIITLHFGPYPHPLLGERERLLQFIFSKGHRDTMTDRNTGSTYLEWPLE